MKKLAKVFALVLTAAMSLSFMASAAFTDEAEIVNKDAVNTVSTLGIIAGYKDGSFQGTKTVTRAEMAKMIYVLKMGGKDDGAAYYKSLNFNLSDINGHWAEGYIKYCASLGIIAGKGDGKFYPDEGVTGLQAAKMLLIVQGYNAEKAGLVGNTWSVKTAALAADSNYFEDFGVNLDDPCPRDYAALLIKNALDATYVVWSTDGNAYVKDSANKDCVTLGKKYFKLHTYEGVLVSTGDYGIPFKYGTSSEYTSTAGEGKLAMIVTKKDDESKVELKSADAKVETFDYTEDLSNMIGQYVKVSVTEAGKAYGVFNVEGNETVATTLNKVKLAKDDNKINIDGKDYKIEKIATETDGKVEVTYAVIEGNKIAKLAKADNSIKAYFENTLEATKSAAAKDGATATFVDYNGNGAFDLVVINKIEKVEKITKVTSSKITAGTTYDLEECKVVGEAAKDKYVAVTKTYFDSDITNVLTVLETVTGKAEATKNSDTEVRFDGTWYSMAANNCKDVDGAGKFKADATYDYCLINDVIYMFDKTAGGSTDTAMVTDLANGRLKLLLADGTKVNTTDYVIVSYKKDSTAKSDINANDLVIYEINDDDEYEIKKIGDFTVANTEATNDAVDFGYDHKAEITNFDEDETGLKDKTTSTKFYTVADDAVVFVKYTEGGKDEYKVITGKQLNAMSRDFGTSGYAFFNGTDDVELACVIATTAMPGNATGRQLAYLTDAPIYYKNDKKTELIVWTVDGEQTIYMKNDVTDKFNEGDVFAYDLTDDEFASSSVTFLSEVVKITDVKDGVSVTFDGIGSKKLSSDIQVINIDSVNVEGVEGNSLGAEDNYARVCLNSDGKILFLVVDTENDNWEVNGAITVNPDAFDKDHAEDGKTETRTYTTNVADVAEIAAKTIVIFNGDLALTDDIKVEGTLTINGKVTGAHNIKVKNGTTVINSQEAESLDTSAGTLKIGEATITVLANVNETIVVNGTTYKVVSSKWTKVSA